jgi:hypothetical protein
MNIQETANAIIQLHKDAGAFQGLDEDAARLLAYKVGLPEIHLPSETDLSKMNMSLREASKYLDIAIEQILGFPRPFGAK